MRTAWKMGFLWLCVLVLVVGVAGCGQGNSSNDNNGSNGSANTSGGSGKKIVLKAWGDLDNQSILEPPFKEVNKRFAELYPDIQLQYDFSQSLESLNVAMQANSLPDIFWVQGNKSTKMAELARNGYILPLDDLIEFDRSRYPEAAIEYTLVDGKMYSSPPSFFDYVVIYYNKDIFQKHKLEKPKTWDEFENVVKTLHEKGVTPIAVSGQGDFDRYWPVQLFAPAFANDTLEAIEKGQADIDYAPLAEMFNKYREFSEKGYFGKNLVATDFAGAQLMFTNGNAAMIIDGSWNNSMYEQTGLNIGRFAIPDKSGTRFAQSGFSNMNTYAISAKTEHPEAAAKYLSFLASREAQQIFEDFNGPIPIVPDLEPKSESIAELAEYDVIGKNIYHVLSAVATETSKPQDRLLTDVLPKLMTAQLTGEEAAKIIETEINNK